MDQVAAPIPNVRGMMETFDAILAKLDEISKRVLDIRAEVIFVKSKAAALRRPPPQPTPISPLNGSKPPGEKSS